MQFEKQIIQSIRKCLNDRKMSQSKLANLSGMSESAISRILNEERALCGNEIANIANSLQLTVEQLMYYPHIPLIYFQDEVQFTKITSDVDVIAKIRYNTELPNCISLDE